MYEPVRALPNDRCPLCGGPNDCAPARCGSLEVDCWCRGARFGTALLARVPQAERRRACICPRCVAAALAEESRDGP
ncbi:MAG: cysteine-rich CWC family protein [Betaproteobacteria bacterium]